MITYGKIMQYVYLSAFLFHLISIAKVLRRPRSINNGRWKKKLWKFNYWLL